MDERVHIVVLVEDYLLKEGLVSKLQSNRDYEVTAVFDKGVECLNYLLNHNCDILIMDLMLTSIDGIGIINQLRKCNPRAFKKLICISDFDSIIFELIEELSIDYCLRKPFNLDYFIEVLNRISKNTFVSNREDSRNVSLKNKINTIFIEMGVPRHLKGYNYLVTGISNVYSNINLLGEVTKELYPGIARTYGTIASRVEQDMRHVIKVTWLNGNQEKLKKIFGYRAKQRPCNSEFISKIVDILSNYDY